MATRTTIESRANRPPEMRRGLSCLVRLFFDDGAERKVPSTSASALLLFRRLADEVKGSGGTLRSHHQDPFDPQEMKKVSEVM